LAQNDIRFNNAKITVHAARTKILTEITLSSQLASGLSKGTEIEILQQLFVASRPAATIIHPRLVHWKSPTIGWIKVNTDGFVITTSTASGGFARKISGNTVLHAELMAFL
jgi:hypothetical protein